MNRPHEQLHALQGAILDNAAHAIIATDLAGGITLFNRAAEQMLGYRSDEVVERHNFTLFLDPAETAQCAEQLQQELGETLLSDFDTIAIRSRLGLVNEREISFVRKDGVRFPVLLTVSALRDEQQQINGYLGLAVDITERKQTEEALLLSREQLNEAQRIAKVGSWSLDLHSNHLEWSDEIYRLFEINPAQFAASYQAFLEAIHPDDRERVNWAYTNSLQTKQPYEITHRLQFPDGRVKYVHEACETLFDDDGTPLLSRGTVQDITALKEAERTIDLYASVFSHSANAILITDSDNRIVAVNPALTRLTGYSEEELLGKNPRVLASGNTPRHVYQEMWASLNSIGHWQGELSDRRKSGEAYPKWITISAIRDDNGDVTNYIANFTDISERKAAEERISYLAHHDPLTGLYNRFSLEERLSQSISQAHRSGAHLAVLFIDMDRFKLINDTLGHGTGDKLLVEVAKRLRHCVRENDIVARLGGDEFIVVLTAIDYASQAAATAEQILEQLRQPYCIDGNDLRSSPSIGVSFYPQDGRHQSELLKHADAAMYHAKAQGRNNFQFFTEQMNTDAHQRMLLERDLRIALEQGQFELYYQPKVDTHSERIVGAEALVRWNHPKRGLVSPFEFIPVAEESGMIDKLGAWVFEEACRQHSQWRTAGHQALHIAVNVSARQLQNPELARHFAAIMARHAIGPGEMELEVTESTAMHDPDKAIVALKALRELGMSIAIDDFGTGYSSLAYLKSLPIQSLKVDRTFVRDIQTDENDAAICRATIHLAHSLGLKVVAEGVETTEQRDFLRVERCDLLQGYLYSRPLPADEFGALLTQKD